VRCPFAQATISLHAPKRTGLRPPCFQTGAMAAKCFVAATSREVMPGSVMA
jgi:hypothetical protein